MRLVTSFSKGGYQLYGKKFIESLIAHWDIPLTVYYETEESDFPQRDNITYRFLGEVPHVQEYCSRAKVRATAGLSWEWNLSKFCRKAFVQAHEMDEGNFYWIDADVIIDSAPTVDLAAIMRNKDIAYMKRDNCWPCTSLVGFGENLATIKDAYLDLYLSDRVFLLDQWQDAHVFGVFAENYPTTDLCEHIPLKEKGFASNVFNLVLPFAHHNKGKLKNK
jgi:hypothetical protein